MHCSRRELMRVDERSVTDSCGYAPIDTGRFVDSLQPINGSNLLLTKAKSR